MNKPLSEILQERFQHTIATAPEIEANATLQQIAGRGSCRKFTDQPVPTPLLEALCAVALSSPSKSDLQQRDIVIISERALKAELSTLLGAQAWIPSVPHILIFCGNHARQRKIHDLTGHEFLNHHLDGFFNATVDAAVALSAFVLAAEAAGLGCCPISTVRNHSDKIDKMLGLPDLVFAVAGLAVGHPAEQPPLISQRLSLPTTVHHNRWTEDGLTTSLHDYDTTRRERQPYETQRRTKDLGHAEQYGWLEEKSRQYSAPERAQFGDYIRRKGFSLD
ncbi:nitroreductase family protein [Pseudorhodobacter aquimaris]|uniref:nitroreductase family protein n=1 Tax=Pseudorhodobacter aquimaris TaxID=687412 RepID=UPI00067D6D0C|nr:nitroreductase family protein [Pseudorhodobacter aquimaris]